MRDNPTFGEVAEEYFNSSEYMRLADRSRQIYYEGLQTAKEFWGDDIKRISRFNLYSFMDRNYGTPGKCRVAMSALRAVFEYACNRGVLENNPIAKIRGMPKSKPIPRWTADEVNLFIETAPYYLKRSVMLALYTGQRASDLVAMQACDYDGKGITVLQKKTGKELYIPAHPRLKEVLDETVQSIPFLIWNRHGQKWSAHALSIAIKRHAEKVGLSNRSVHGIRKSTASHLAEIGATVSQIAAITGQSLKEVERYTRQADQKKMAQQAMEKWI